MNIVLIGYRGGGKSTVARLLASALQMPQVCLDEEIVKRAGRRIPEIVATHGWEYFRDLESEVAADYGNRNGWVIDAGGGVILRDENVQNLRRNGTLIWLTAPPSVLIERIDRDGTGSGWTGEYIEARIRAPDLKPNQILRFTPSRCNRGVLS